MDRKKPSLTSPWKVGFLVALLLVVTSLGVSYFITGTFGVTWHWIHIGGLQPSTWTFNPGAFIEEMVPLLVLTALLAFAAYVLVAGAVRRYKGYVDSGADYKHLLKSIKTIDDLDDANVLEQLKQHPEIREFLMGIKRRVAAASEHHGERERKQPAPSASSSRDERPRLPSESALLASAIANGRDAFSRELALTVPELKQIERALRQHFADARETEVATPGTAAAAADSGQLDALRASVIDAARSIRRDMEACAGGARELEVALTRLGAVAEGGVPFQNPSQSTSAVESRIDATAEALGALGEETRRIAIASALQASGGPDADAIKVADELRALATKFNTVAQHWRETAPALKQHLSNGGKSAPSNDAVTAAVANAVSRARLWSERLVALNDSVRALESAVQNGDGASSYTPAPATGSRASDAPAARPANEPVAAPEPAFTSDAGEDFITRGNREMFAPDDDASVAFADIPFEKERRFFADASGNEEPDDRFQVDRADESRWDLSGDSDEAAAPAAQAAAPAAQAAAPAPEAPAADSGHDADGFLTGPRPVVSTKKVKKETPAPEAPRVRKPAPAPEPEPAAVATTATLDPDADAIDLYELGAVECVQTV